MNSKSIACGRSGGPMYVWAAMSSTDLTIAGGRIR